MTSIALVDKKLVAWSDYCLSETGDLCVVENEYNHLQAAQNRIISHLGSRVHDENYWCELHEFMNDITPILLTQEVVTSFVSQALDTMLRDGRVEEITDVKILERDTTSATIQIVLKIWVYTWEIVFTV